MFFLVASSYQTRNPKFMQGSTYFVSFYHTSKEGDRISSDWTKETQWGIKSHDGVFCIDAGN